MACSADVDSSVRDKTQGRQSFRRNALIVRSTMYLCMHLYSVLCSLCSTVEAPGLCMT